MSKLAICRDIAGSNPLASRQELISMFLEHFPTMTNAVAGSYASQVRKDVMDNAAAVIQMPSPIKQESDKEIHDRLMERFDVIETLTAASCKGKIRSLVISGPAGLGKSYTVEKVVEQYDPDEEKTIVAKGFVKATGLYLLLHEYRNKGNVIVLDDADSIFADQDALNILKAALDTSKKRIISWRSETKMVDADGEPVDRYFEFEGTVIFITNKNFDKEVQKGGKMAEHFDALLSRSMYVDTSMHSQRDYIIRIRQVVAQGMLRSKGLAKHEESTIVGFLEDNADSFRELTLRAVLKLADLFMMDSNKLHSLAKVSLFKPNRM